MKTFISAIQWMAFMIAGAIAAPIAIADLFQLDPLETAAFVQRTIFVLGVASLLQGSFGHRLPIHEGPAGLWWGVFAIYASFVGTLYVSETETLRALSGGMVVSGICFFILTFFGFMEKLAKLFTPTITFIYLMLLILQLSGSFLKGMLGITADTPVLQPLVSILSMAVVAIAFYLGQHRVLWIRQFSIMFSLVIGWLIFSIFGKAPAVVASDKWLIFPEILAFGTPLFDAGTIVTSLFITLLLTTNMIASIRVLEAIINKDAPTDALRYKRGGFISGISQITGGMFASIGSVPISGAAGFVSQTGMKTIKPFALGASLVIIISLFPPLMNIMASIPAPVGYAVTFVIFTKMVGMALREIERSANRERTYSTAGLALLVGVGAMFLPPEATLQLPTVIASLLNNGLVLGTVIAIITEQYFIRKDARR